MVIIVDGGEEAGVNALTCWLVGVVASCIGCVDVWTGGVCIFPAATEL
jgi:hypothetical protein